MSKRTVRRLGGAEAKRRFSELLGRAAYAGETVLIVKRGKPMAKLVPPDSLETHGHLARIKGWLAEHDPFFTVVDEIVRRRADHTPRVHAPRVILKRVPPRSERKRARK